MAHSNRFSTLLFWLMILLGTAALAPCLVLPAWLERQAQIECLKAGEAHVAALKHRLRTARKQIEHLNNDPAYVLRVAEREFGYRIEGPHVETILIDPSPEQEDSAASGVAAHQATPERDEELWPELTASVGEAVQRYRYARVFLDSRTRPLIMAMSSGLILAAIVLLGRSDRRPDRGASVGAGHAQIAEDQ